MVSWPNSASIFFFFFATRLLRHFFPKPFGRTRVSFTYNANLAQGEKDTTKKPDPALTWFCATSPGQPRTQRESRILRNRDKGRTAHGPSPNNGPHARPASLSAAFSIVHASGPRDAPRLFPRPCITLLQSLRSCDDKQHPRARRPHITTPALGPYHMEISWPSRPLATANR